MDHCSFAFIRQRVCQGICLVGKLLLPILTIFGLANNSASAEPLATPISCHKVFALQTDITKIKDIDQNNVTTISQTPAGPVEMIFMRNTNRDLERLRYEWQIPGTKISDPLSADYLAGKTFLDVGAGTGTLAADLHKVNDDLSADKKITIIAIDIAPQEGSTFVTKDDALNLSMLDNSVDVYHSWESALSYFSRDPWDEPGINAFSMAFNEAVRVTKPGGLILFTARGTPQAIQAMQDPRVELIYPILQEDNGRMIAIDQTGPGNGLRRVILQKK